ncbi:hypothetical protein GCM10009665_06860 [Kitasatospora nipponensis]|uniref:Uncharacterized protein n=1 Tax=Kitasatospora nipponensis TaxID=258049 RepID=A0ABN1VQ47_9ACTN
MIRVSILTVAPVSRRSVPQRPGPGRAAARSMPVRAGLTRGAAGLLVLFVALLGLLAHHSLSAEMAMPPKAVGIGSMAAMAAPVEPSADAAMPMVHTAQPATLGVVLHASMDDSSSCSGHQHCVGTPQQNKPLTPHLPAGAAPINAPQPACLSASHGFPSRSGAPPPDLSKLSVSRT